MRETFIVKKETSINDLKTVSPRLLLVFSDFCIYAQQNSLPVLVTSIKEDVQGRLFSTHTEGRAIDISSRGWGNRSINTVIEYLTQKYKSYAAISSSDLEPRLIIHHHIDGGADHFHIQVKD